MIRNTFSILNGIGERLERRLWKSGIMTWSDFVHTGEVYFLNPDKKIFYDAILSDALTELDNANAVYFANTIRRREHWRLFNIFKENAVCLDIETNGLMPGSGGYVTLIGIYNGYEYKFLLKNENLTRENLSRELSGYKYLITFYGAGFDIPFLMRAFPGLQFTIPHFDVCYGSKKLGFRGGLKKLEASLGISREDAVKNMNGYDAVKLWGYAQQGSTEALDLLKMYNREDTVNLFSIAKTIYGRLRIQTGIEEFLS